MQLKSRSPSCDIPTPRCFLRHPHGDLLGDALEGSLVRRLAAWLPMRAACASACAACKARAARAATRPTSHLPFPRRIVLLRAPSRRASLCHVILTVARALAVASCPLFLRATSMSLADNAAYYAIQGAWSPLYHHHSAAREARARCQTPDGPGRCRARIEPTRTPQRGAASMCCAQLMVEAMWRLPCS